MADNNNNNRIEEKNAFVRVDTCKRKWARYLVCVCVYACMEWVRHECIRRGECRHKGVSSRNSREQQNAEPQQCICLDSRMSFCVSLSFLSVPSFLVHCGAQRIHSDRALSSGCTRDDSTNRTAYELCGSRSLNSPLHRRREEAKKTPHQFIQLQVKVYSFWFLFLLWDLRRCERVSLCESVWDRVNVLPHRLDALLNWLKIYFFTNFADNSKRKRGVAASRRLRCSFRPPVHGHMMLQFIHNKNSK